MKPLHLISLFFILVFGACSSYCGDEDRYFYIEEEWLLPYENGDTILFENLETGIFDTFIFERDCYLDENENPGGAYCPGSSDYFEYCRIYYHSNKFDIQLLFTESRSLVRMFLDTVHYEFNEYAYKEHQNIHYNGIQSDTLYFIPDNDCESSPCDTLIYSFKRGIYEYSFKSQRFRWVG